jgi:hypothetical protein
MRRLLRNPFRYSLRWFFGSWRTGKPVGAKARSLADASNRAAASPAKRFACNDSIGRSSVYSAVAALLAGRPDWRRIKGGGSGPGATGTGGARFDLFLGQKNKDVPFGRLGAGQGTNYYRGSHCITLKSKMVSICSTSYPSTSYPASYPARGMIVYM